MHNGTTRELIEINQSTDSAVGKNAQPNYRNGHDRDEDQRYEHKDPQVSLGLQLVASEQFKHQQNEVQRQGDQHCLVVDVCVALEPRVGMSPPNVTPYHGTQDDHTLPKPDGCKHRPVTPCYVIVEA